MDPKALILLVLSAFAVIILAIGAGMGQDYRSRESTNSTAEASMNRFSTAEGANIYSSTSEASITSTFASENANPHIEINTECIKFFTEYDQRNCSYNYNSDDCYSIQLPEDNKLTDLDREELNGIRRKYPNVFSLFHYLRLREDDAQFVNLFVMPDQSESRSGYFKQLDYVVDIIHELDSSFNRTGCWYRPPNATEFFDNELETLLQGRETFALSMLKNISKVSWNEFNVPLKDRLIRFIIQIGFSLDISIKDCWEDYVSKNRNNSNSPIRDLCSTGKLLGNQFYEGFSNNTLTRSHFRPKRDLPGKKSINNGDNIGSGKKQVLKKKEDDLVKSKEAPDRPMHAGKSYEKMRGNGYLLRSRKGLAIKNSNKIPF